MEKRLVFLNGDQPPRIFGVCAADALPVTIALDSLGVPFASLVRSTPRAAYYRAPMVPQSYGSMHPSQR